MEEENMMKGRTVLWIFLAFALGFLLPVASCVGTGLLTVGLLSQIDGQTTMPARGAGDAVGVIDLNGMIVGQSTQQVLSSGGITPDRVRELLEQAADRSDVKAVVVRVNSPGGSVVASDEIYHMFLDFEKPVVIWLGDTAASGGYYISCGGDYVYAHPDTLTGSIGVISQFINAQELLEDAGVEVTIITSGPHKDMSSLFRDMTEEEREIWDGILDQIYDDFVQVVVEARDLPEETVRELADGRIYTGQQAAENRLVDEVGLSTDAVAKAAELAEIEGEPRVVEIRPAPTFLETLYTLQGRAGAPTLADILAWAAAPSVAYRLVGP